MKKCDFIVIIAVVLFAMIWLFSAKEGSVASVYINGELYKKMPLSVDDKLVVKSEFGENTIIVKDGVVFIENSDCENKHCQREKISSASRSLVCLPNRLSVIVEGRKNNEEADVLL